MDYAAARSRRKEHDLQVSLPAEEVYLHADPVRLTQVLTNLLHNAAKYTDSRGRIWLNAGSENGQIVIRVHDTGIGIAECNRESSICSSKGILPSSTRGEAWASG